MYFYWLIYFYFRTLGVPLDFILMALCLLWAPWQEGMFAYGNFKMIFDLLYMSISWFSTTTTKKAEIFNRSVFKLGCFFPSTVHLIKNICNSDLFDASVFKPVFIYFFLFFSPILQVVSAGHWHPWSRLYAYRRQWNHLRC